MYNASRDIHQKIGKHEAREELLLLERVRARHGQNNQSITPGYLQSAAAAFLQSPIPSPSPIMDSVKPPVASPGDSLKRADSG